MISTATSPEIAITPGYEPSANFKSYLANSLNKKLEFTLKPETNDVPGKFVAILAHEVRNPLTNINLSINMLSTLTSDKRIHIFLDIIKRNTTRINELVGKLLNYRKEDELIKEKISLYKLMDEVLEMTSDKILLKNITVCKKYETENDRMLLNGEEIKIALTNIIINAIDAMDSTKGQLTIVSKSINGKHAVHIHDNGCGISKANLKNIFKPFYTNKPGGLGLGLATTYDILVSNSVGVKVKSTEGQGTCFMLLFDNGPATVN